MKILVLTLHNDETKERTKPLRESCLLHGFEFNEELISFTFGQQYHLIANFARQYKGDATHMLYTDAWDTLCFGSHDETVDNFKALNCKMLISGEKACFPYHWRSVEYPETSTPWKYINGGGSLFEIEYFNSMTANNPFKADYIDPDYLFDLFLKDRNNIRIDTNCEVFQTIAFSNVGEWETINSRPMNKGTLTYPIFFHGNGHTEMNWLYELSQEQRSKKGEGHSIPER